MTSIVVSHTLLSTAANNDPHFCSSSPFPKDARLILTDLVPAFATSSRQVIKRPTFPITGMTAAEIT
jgi:hypothetical protein